MKLHTDQEQEDFETRQAVWVQANIAPIAAVIREYAEAPAGRGRPETAYSYLRHVSSSADAIATASLTAMVAGMVRQDGLTAIANSVAREVGKATGNKPGAGKESVALGYWLISAVCAVTGAVGIVNKFADKPQKVEGGIKLQAAYELREKPGTFLADAVEYGAAGMPQYSKEPLAPWTSQDSCEDHDAGMIHDAGRQMAGVTDNSAPQLFRAVNAAQSAEFRVNPVTAAVVLKYDAAKAQAWIADNIVRPRDGAKLAKRAEEIERAKAEKAGEAFDPEKAKLRAEWLIQNAARELARL